MPELSACRSILFLPASNPRAIEKARGLAADMVILDLEDAVRPEDKATARDAAVRALQDGFGPRIAAVRVNPVGHPEHGADLRAARLSPADYVVVPKVDSAAEVTASATLCGKPILAMIETPAGVLDASAIARVAAGLIAGTNDLAAELRLPPASGRHGLAMALQQLVLAARAAGVAAFDGVYNGLADDAGLIAQAEEGRDFGFDGKSVIHPSQIDPVNRIFSPGETDIAAARALVAAATGGAERHDGRMIEAMHVAQARRVLARAGSASRQG